MVRIQTDLGAGSGFIIGSDGLVLTNNHVIRDAETITIFLEDGTRYIGKVQGRDLLRDLAVVNIEASNLPKLQMGDVSRVSLGSEVAVVGYPLGVTGLTVTEGSASGIKYDAGSNITLIQTNSTINPGNSGGPMFNLQGQVIGVVAGRITGGGVESAAATDSDSPAGQPRADESPDEAADSCPWTTQRFWPLMRPNISVTKS